MPHEPLDEPEFKKRKIYDVAAWVRTQLEELEFPEDTISKVLARLDGQTQQSLARLTAEQLKSILFDTELKPGSLAAVAYGLYNCIHPPSPQAPVPRLLTLAPPPLVSFFPISVAYPSFLVGS